MNILSTGFSLGRRHTVCSWDTYCDFICIVLFMAK